jgi:hypothetical protein
MFPFLLVCTWGQEKYPNEQKRSRTRKAVKSVVLKTTGVNCWEIRAAREPQSFGVRHTVSETVMQEFRSFRLSSAIVEDGVRQEVRVQPENLHADGT